MKERDKPAIVTDMQKISLPIAVANKIAEASKLTESEAEDFAHDNKHLVSLTHSQEEALLVLIAPHYESIVRRHINIHLSQHEYDALVSFVYNPGGSFLPIAHLLNHGKTSDAMNVLKSRNRTDGRVNNGLIHRRNDEVQLFLHGAYERHANKIQHRHK